MAKFFLFVTFSFLLSSFLCGVVLADELLFSDDFSDGELIGWEIVD
jgi:hypothetical protein